MVPWIMMKKILPILLFSVLMNTVITPSSPPRFIPILIGEEEFQVEIADTEKKKTLGLMFRKSIPDNYGMLFIYSREDYRGIWMKNTLIHLDLIFMNSAKEIIRIFHNVPPCKKDPCKTYIPEEKAQYVLEMKGNRAKSLDLKPGDRIFFIL